MSDNLNMNIDEVEDNTLPVNETETVNENVNNQNNRRTLTQEEKQQLLNREVTVNLNLLLNARILIEVSNSRAAFKAGELSQVGIVYDELNKMVNDNLSLENNN
jgi:hypothetical protein